MLLINCINVAQLLPSVATVPAKEKFIRKFVAMMSLRAQSFLATGVVKFNFVLFGSNVSGT